MALRVIRQSPPTGQYMTVTVKGDSQDEFQTKEARDLAHQTALTSGFRVSGLSNFPTVYPVDEEDSVTEDVCFGRTKASGYVSTFQFGAGL